MSEQIRNTQDKAQARGLGLRLRRMEEGVKMLCYEPTATPCNRRQFSSLEKNLFPQWDSNPCPKDYSHVVLILVRWLTYIGRE